MIIKNGNVYCSDGAFSVKDIYISDGVITNDREKALMDSIVIDASDRYVLPGLVDIHSHGAYGHDFCDASPEGLKAILKYEKQHGITSYCPTSMTLSFEMLEKIFDTTNQVSGSKDEARIVGINMEGPFIAAHKKGAQNGKYIRTPDIDAFRHLNDLCDNRIKLVTLAPELSGSLDFIKELKDEVHISIGHTEATYDETIAAFQTGADHVTHLCNAMPPFHHRDTGVFGAAADAANVYVELICDGLHIHPSMIRTIFRIFGADRVCLISDSMEATGMDDGQYALGGQTVIKKGNLATLTDGTLAGSATNLYDCMKKAVSFGIPLADAVKSVTTTPARSIGMESEIGSLDIGARADVLIVSKDLELISVI